MLVVIPLVCWFLIARLLVRRGDDLRSSFLIASVYAGTLLTVFTEVLSVFEALTGPAVAAAWALACLPPALLAARTRPSAAPGNRQPADSLALWAGGSIAAVLLTTAVIAFIAPPNNWDSVVYHMSRVMHWEQNRSIAHYPTHIPRQIFFPPGAEFAVLHAQLLSGGDRFANFVQWFAMAGSVLGVSLIAKQLGGGRAAQFLAALFCATIPMGILQSTSTQNDYVAGFWLVAFAAVGLRFRNAPAWGLAVPFGASLGLAVLTKGTSYVYGLPFLLWTSAALLRRSRAKAVPFLAVAAAVVIALNAGHAARNIAVLGHPLAEERKFLANEAFGPGPLLSNVLRNIALQFNTPSAAFDRAVVASVSSVHDALGMDVNDKRTTLYTDFQLIGFFGLKIHEDVAGNPVHAVLIMIALPWLLLSGRARALPGLRAFALAALSAFLLFCLYLKWQPWHSRLLLPVVVLWAPAAGLALSSLPGRKAALGASALLVLSAVPALLFNASRPLIARDPLPRIGIGSILTTGRLDQYFNNLPQQRPGFIAFGREVCGKGCGNVGLKVVKGDGEYLLWATLKAFCATMPRIEHIEVPAQPGIRPLGEFQPCAIAHL